MDRNKIKAIIEQVIIEKKLCPKGKAYYNRRIAAGEVPSAYLSGRAVKVCKGLMEEDDLEEGQYDDTSNFDLVKQNPFDIKKLVDKGIIFITKPGDGKGGVDEPNWEGDASIITLYNMSNAEPWMKEAVKTPLPKAISYIQKDQDKLLYNGKYNQILWGVEKKGFKPEDFYLNMNEAINPLGWEPIIKAESEEIERTAEDLNLPYDTVYDAFVNGREVTLNNDMWSRLENTDSYDIDSEEEAIELARQYGKDYQSILAAEKTPPALILQYSPNKFYLVGGNTRLMFARAKGINPQVILATIEPKAKWAYQDVTGEIDESLRDWFDKEDWVRIDTQGNITGDCGTMKKGKATTRCLPRAKANRLTKVERAATARKKAAADRKGDRVVSNTDKAKVKFRK